MTEFYSNRSDIRSRSALPLPPSAPNIRSSCIFSPVVLSYQLICSIFTSPISSFSMPFIYLFFYLFLFLLYIFYIYLLHLFLYISIYLIPSLLLSSLLLYPFDLYIFLLLYFFQINSINSGKEHEKGHTTRMSFLVCEKYSILI